MKVRSLFLFSLLGLFGCESDDIRPHYQALFEENLKVQNATAYIFLEGSSIVIIDSMNYVAYQDGTNSLTFTPWNTQPSYDYLYFLSSDSLFSAEDMELPFENTGGAQETSIEDMLSTPYLLALSKEDNRLVSFDKFPLTE